jgi:putative hydrolase of the HAD superfamily
MLSANGIRAIFFDLDGTLRFNIPSGREFFMDRASVLGVPVTQADRDRTWRWEHLYWAESAELHADMAAFPEREAFWRHYSRRQLVVLGCRPEEAEMLAPQIHQYMIEQYKPESWVPPGTISLLKDLRGAGYMLGVISNRDNPFDEELTHLGLGGFFHLTVSAGEARSKKPDVVIFGYALDRVGRTASEAIYVGDNYYADVVGARNAGISPVLLDRGRIFTDPGCPAITSLSELPGVIEKISDERGK